MSYQNTLFENLASCFLAVVLSSCGGGGGNTSSPVTPEPVAPPQPSVGVTKFPDLDWDVEDPEVANVLSVGVNEAWIMPFKIIKIRKAS